uniref:U6 snRNA-associated Sm-like protein LSm7 n=1 Tax=Schizosaccharomyces pombe (strain 972 / ATCC 24843) TaxID=284812 RepID=UPI00022F83FB|nr:Chain C, U6 snRNA-associated Sm-like protein LSm7 [Schizosaccharomyces pombe 972h-]3SWN_F Chain F, U6 snRNA-associated Sm-like protein LSm7 [Schizosaccharomyces pombe 972h-]3SWN_O Chain O, U6 snRNA-associated Sm-like protein LSm7 [Schizosaccharomyces pombe 972h-]3SWN_R Chain R, U6 snRNA-associated Sm-like protein LSm7 [Schizosaccharomyces pombe 972h-]
GAMGMSSLQKRPGPGNSSQPTERPRKESILDLSRYQDQRIQATFTGGRQITGILKGFDQLMNLVLDDVEEQLRNPEDGKLTGAIRKLGLVVVRGTTLVLIAPMDGSEEIPNPFVQAE